MRKKLKQMTITSEGKEMPFRDFANEVGGSGVLYERDIRELFNNWKEADSSYVDDYIAPIAAQVIIDASELDRALYEKIMTVIYEGYVSLRSEIDPNHPTLIRIK